MMNTGRPMKWVIPVILIIAAGIILSSMVYVVRENEYALVVRFGADIVRQDASAGIKFKVPFIEEARKYPKTKIFYDLPLLDVLTSDTRAMTADSFVVWRIDDPFLFYQAVGTIAGAEIRINAAAFNTLQVTISSMTQSSIISGDERSRNNLNITVFENVRQAAVEYGVEILDVKVKRFELQQDNEQSVFRRMISDREQLAESFKADGRYEANLIVNEVDRDVGVIVSDARAEAAKIIAEGEEEYMRILAQAYSTQDRQEFFRFIRGLDALKESLSGGENTVILDRESVLAQILTSP